MSKEEMNQIGDEFIEAVNANSREREAEREAKRTAEKPSSPIWKIVKEVAPPVLVISCATRLFTFGQIAQELYGLILNAGLVYFGWKANNAHRIYLRTRRKA